MDTLAPAPKIPVTVALPPALVGRLDAVAERQDRSRSWVTREAIAKYLADAEAPLPERGP